jgi:ACS family glucarate transporter-like MFS transporter
MEKGPRALQGMALPERRVYLEAPHAMKEGDPGDLDPRPTRVRYRVMGFLCVLSFLTYFDRVCIIRAQGLIQADLGLGDAEMGLVLGAFWLAYALFEIPGGWMGDRFGTRRTLTRIVLCWSLFTALTGSAAGFLSLLAWRFLFGAGEAGAYPNMARVQSQWLPPASRARAGGLLWLLARWGGAFSPLIFGGLLRLFDSGAFRGALAAVPGLEAFRETASWRLGFWAAGLAGVLWCLAFYPWFRDRPAEMPSVNRAERDLIAGGGEETPPAGHGGMDRRAWRALFLSKGLWAMGLLYISHSFAWSFFVSWMPRYLKEVHSLEFDRSEAMSALPLFFGGIACLAGGWMSDRLVRRTGRKWLGRAVFPLAGYSLAAAAMYGIRFVETPGQAMALMCLAAAGGDLGQGANWATIVDLGGRYAGAATGFINMVGNAGNYLQPVVGAVIFNRLGWNALFAVYAAGYLIAASMWLFIDPRRTFHEPHAPAAGREPLGEAAAR